MENLSLEFYSVVLFIQYTIFALMAKYKMLDDSLILTTLAIPLFGAYVMFIIIGIVTCLSPFIGLFFLEDLVKKYFKREGN